jgi:ankyrin
MDIELGEEKVLATIAHLESGLPETATEMGWFKRTLLHVACKYGRDDIAVRLLEAGASIRAKDFQGRNPLAIAASMNHIACCKMLVGIATYDTYDIIRAEDTDGRSPLAIACCAGHVEIVKFLAPIFCHHLHRLSGKYGNTALGIAAMMHRTECCRILVANGARVDDRNIGGRTALAIACNSTYVRTAGNTGCCEFLISAGANINAQDHKGLTALDIATKMSEGYCNDLCELLVSRGAKLGDEL